MEKQEQIREGMFTAFGPVGVAIGLVLFEDNREHREAQASEVSRFS